MSIHATLAANTSANALFTEQVETLLKTQDVPDYSKDIPQQDSATAYVANTIQKALPGSNDYANDPEPTTRPFMGANTSMSESFQIGGANANTGEPNFSWEMIGLGLEEPMPPQDVVDDLWVTRLSLRVAQLTC